MAEKLIASTEILASTLKTILDCAGPVCKDIVIDIGTTIRFWGKDEGSTARVIGYVNDALPADGAARLQVRVKELAHRLAGFDLDSSLAVEVYDLGRKAHELRLRYEETVRGMSVDLATDESARPEDGRETGLALVDAGMFSKVVASLKPYTDSIQLEIMDGYLNATYSSTRSKDGWKHPVETAGEGKSLFGSATLTSICKGAAKAAKNITLHLGNNEMLRIETSGKIVTVEYFLANRTLMT